MGWAWVLIVFFVLFWTIGLSIVADFLDRLNDPYPSARAFNVLKHHLRKMREQLPNDHIVDPALGMKLRQKGRDVEIHANGEKLSYPEDQAKLLTLHLLTIYPELENNDFVPVFERLPMTKERYVNQQGAIWC